MQAPQSQTDRQCAQAVFERSGQRPIASTPRTPSDAIISLQHYRLLWPDVLEEQHADTTTTMSMTLPVGFNKHGTHTHLLRAAAMLAMNEVSIPCQPAGAIQASTTMAPFSGLLRPCCHSWLLLYFSSFFSSFLPPLTIHATAP